MLRSISITGLGPHATTTLAIPDGDVVISGRSEAGKSLLIDAVCWALWGTGRDGKRLPDALIRADGEAMEVAATTLSGKTFSRRRKAGGTDAISVALDGAGSVRVTSQEVLATHLKALGDAERGRLIFAPFAWRDLAEGPGSGRALREFLDRVLPGPTAAELLADELIPGEPADAKRAEAERKEARKVAERAAGALGEAQRSLAAETDPPAEPDPGRVAEAREVLARHEETCRTFQAVIDAAEPWRRAWNAYTTRQDQIARRGHRVAALRAPDGDRPTGAALAAAEKAADDAGTEESAARAAVTVARTALRRLQESIERMMGDLSAMGLERDRAAADPCRGVKAGACQIASRAAQEVAKIDARAADLTSALDVALADLPAAQEVANAAELRNTAAMEATPPARAEQRRLAALDRAWAQHDRDLAALGPELEPLTDPGPEPTAPKPGILPPGTRELIAQADSYPARLADHADRLDRLRARVTEAQAAVGAAPVRVDRAERVLELVRSAPGRALANKIATLTDLGPVSVELTADAIDVQIDGRPWRLASTGRQIVADATFRASLRRAVGLGWLPIVVDEVQSVGGQALPELTPAWLLRTTDGDLAVRAVPHA